MITILHSWIFIWNDPGHTHTPLIWKDQAPITRSPTQQKKPHQPIESMYENVRTVHERWMIFLGKSLGEYISPMDPTG